MESSRVFVGNIDTGIVTAEDITSLFGKFGPVDVVMKQGYAFVQYATEELATAAIAEFNGAQLKGRSLTVNFAARLSFLFPASRLPHAPRCSLVAPPVVPPPLSVVSRCLLIALLPPCV